jgi:glutaredoxin
MTIDIYGKPGCGKCEAAKEKLRLLGIPYREHDIEYHGALHDGWRDDGSVDALAAYSDMDDLPILRVDGECLSYSEAMKYLKGRSER